MVKDFLFFVAVGFSAQLVDGALGMAYGVISMTMLLSLNIPPAVASASVHIAEIFTTGASGLSHAIFKNINRDLFVRLAIPGVLGGITGAYFLTQIPIHIVRPCIMIYLFTMGCYIIYKAIKYKLQKFKHPSNHKVIFLGLSGGFLDAAGGGGWGPIVTTSLVALGVAPRYAIGSTNLAEFLVTLSTSAMFIIMIGVSQWFIIFGLLIGGVVAAPLAAYVTKVIPPRVFMFLVGFLIITLCVRALVAYV